MIINFRKILSCILVMAIIFCYIPEINIFAAVLETKNGVLDIEAENTAFVKTNLSVVSDKMFSEGKGLSVGQETKTTPDSSEAADIDLSFKADQAGTYTIWLRSTARPENGAGNSIFLSLDGGNYKYTQIGGEPESPQWRSIGTIAVTNAGETAKVRLKTRQRYITYDRFIITCNAGYKPDDAALGITTVASPVASSAPVSTSVPSSTPSAVPPLKPDLTTKDGYIVVEAESLKYNQNNFKLVTGDDMSGGKALEVTNEDKTTPANDSPADIDLSFTADQAGTYVIWTRNKSNNTSGGINVFMSLNNGKYAITTLNGTPTEFAWTKLGSVTVKAGEIGSVRLIRRQRISIVFDKFVITNNKLYTPKDMGDDRNSIGGVKLPDNVYPRPTITPPPEHPRLMLTSKDIPDIKANFTAEQNSGAYEVWKKQIAIQIDGILPAPSKQGASNYKADVLTTIEALAFDYVINANEESGKNAIAAIRNFVNSIEFDADPLSYRYKGHVIFTVAQVYDWCYGLLSEKDKVELIAYAESIANGLDMGYPPKGQGAVCGHGGENNLFRDLLSLGIAAYNERPDIYNYCAGRILAEHVPARNYMYESNAHSQGNAYGAYRGGWEIWSAWLFKKMSGQDIFSAEQQYFPYEWLYSRRPDGQTLRTGDDFFEASLTNADVYWSTWTSTLFLVSNYYNDPYLKREYAREAPSMSVFKNEFSVFTPVTFLVFNNPNLQGKPSTQLPLAKYFSTPRGMMISRTGWNDGKTSSDVVALMNIGERYGANHAHLDSGNFQLYYKGILAGESGLYSDGNGSDHAGNYAKRGIAHNTLTIYDPNETATFYTKPVENDGGLRFPGNAIEPATLDIWLQPEYEIGKVLGHEFGPDPMVPEYSYIKGDITKGYTNKVNEVLRSMLFMPLEDEAHPAVMIVMDKVEAKDPTFKKAWLLHTQEEPKVEGNKTIVTRTQKDYNGRMVVETLLPKNPKIETVGGEGKQFWFNGKDYPPAKLDPSNSDSEGAAWGRVEVSPSAASNTDFFLNVMTVSDADTKAADLQSALIESENFVGAVVSDRVAIFGKDAARMENQVKFTIPGTGSYKVFVSSMKEGTWETADGQQIVVTKEGGAAYFNAEAGDVVLTYKDASAVRTAIQPVTDQNDYVGIRINKAFVYSDVKPVVIQDRTLVPMRVIFENLGATVTYDDATKTATATKDGTAAGGAVEIKITQDSTTVYVNGQMQTLDVPATVVNDRFVVPIRFVSEALGAKVVWDSFANLVDITPAVDKPAAVRDGVVVTASSFEAGTPPENTYDGDKDTWCTMEGEQWIMFEFPKPKEISSVSIAFYNGDKRQAIFDIQVSADGATFNTVFSGKSSGMTKDFEEFKFYPTTVKAVRILGHGNTTNAKTSIYEVEFK